MGSDYKNSVNRQAFGSRDLFQLWTLFLNRVTQLNQLDMINISRYNRVHEFLSRVCNF